eukprot:8582104-Alexandrium_andersonii.AAC.1
MSASLVGSEMCIRDRCTTRLEAGRSCPKQYDAALHPSSVASSARRPSAPVSYTHLTLPTICSV